MKKIALLLIIISIALIACDNQSVQNNETANNINDMDQAQPQASEEKKKEISLDEAKEIAIKRAYLTNDEVTFTKAELDDDDGVRNYDIEFTSKNKEYDYSISAADGKIVSSKVSYNSAEPQKLQQQQKPEQPQNPQQQQQTQQQQTPQVSPESKKEISVNEAKEIALKHANLTSDKVTFTKAELDVDDDGVRKYEIEFTYNNKEYEYEINASTGVIISVDIDD